MSETSAVPNVWGLHNGNRGDQLPALTRIEGPFPPQEGAKGWIAIGWPAIGDVTPWPRAPAGVRSPARAEHGMPTAAPSHRSRRNPGRRRKITGVQSFVLEGILTPRSAAPLRRAPSRCSQPRARQNSTPRLARPPGRLPCCALPFLVVGIKYLISLKTGLSRPCG